MRNLIDGREVTPAHLQTMTNCRLKKTRDALRWLLSCVEEEMDARMGKGGGGLK